MNPPTNPKTMTGGFVEAPFAGKGSAEMNTPGARTAAKKRAPTAIEGSTQRSTVEQIS
jgi:hypothetical protein